MQTLDSVETLLPRVAPPEDNADLDSKTQQGLAMEEMVLAKRPRDRTKVAARKEVEARFERMIEWCSWKLILNGRFMAQRPEGGVLEVGDHELRYVKKLRALEKVILEEDQHCRLIMVTKVARHQKRHKALAEIEAECNAEIFFHDKGFFEDGKQFRYLPGSVILGVFGYKPIGRVFCTGVSYQLHHDKESDNDYHKFSQAFLPELTKPEKIVVCKL